MKEELVDILLATYNSNEEFLKLQIDSILNQSYKNINLLISDDASTNKGILNVLQHYEMVDKRVRIYMQEKNIGYLKNFEFLLNKSNANYVMFSDHDDIWHEDKIEKCLKKLKEEDLDLVYCNCTHIDEKGKVLYKSYIDYKSMPKFETKLSKDGKTDKEILPFSRHIAIGCSQLFTKSVKEKMLPFTDKMMAHDWASLYIANRFKGVGYIDEPLFDYRIHSSNVFGGRNLTQNLKKWKSIHGKDKKAFREYREDVIQKHYLDGALMCKEYSLKIKDEIEKELIDSDNTIENKEKKREEKTEEKIKISRLEDSVILYYEDLLNTKSINFKTFNYSKYLKYKGIGKRKLKEKLIFHFPIIAYIIYRFK